MAIAWMPGKIKAGSRNHDILGGLDLMATFAARVGNYKAVFNIRGDNGAATGGLAVDSNLGWRGPEKHVATVPQIFDLWADPQERYDLFMNDFTERTWTLVTINEAVKDMSRPE